MIWIFVWLLMAGGSQYSDAYDTQLACEAARATVDAARLSPVGRPVEMTHPCERIQ